MKVGDRVKISKSSQYYEGESKGNPKCEGFIREMSSSYGGTHPLSVNWDNGNRNVYKESDLEIIEPTMKQEKIKPQTFCIIGKPYHLQAVEEDLKEIGYYISNYNTDHREGGICSNFDNYKDLEEFLYITRMLGGTDKVFELPSQYSEALQFCKEQKEIAENYFKKDEEFKKGQWIYRSYSNGEEQLGRFQKIENDVYKASEVYVTVCNKLIQEHINEIKVGSRVGEWKAATKEQIEKVLSVVAAEKGFIKGVEIYPIDAIDDIICRDNITKISYEDFKYIVTDKEYPQFADSLQQAEGAGNIYHAGLWAEIVKETFPQITIAGYKGVFEKDIVKFGCNHIPKETFISLYEVLKKLPGKNEFISMEMRYNEYAFNISIDQLYKIADYYTNK